MASIRPDETKCYKGLHEWNEENVYTDPSGKSACRPCLYESRAKPESERHPKGASHCRRGHAYTPENTIKQVKFRNGERKIERSCRQCQKDARKTTRR